MPVAVVISAECRFRIERARVWLATRDSAEELLILGASLNAANELARSMAKVKGAAFGWHRLTLAQLAASIALPQLTERRLASITALGMEAAVTRLAHRLRTEGRVGRFAPIAGTPGFPRAIASVMTELRLSRLSPQVVASVAPDVAALLAAYEAELAEMALADWPAVLALASEGARAHQFSGLPLLLLDVPVRSEAELVFLRTLAANAPEIFATVPAADRPTLARLEDDLGWRVEDLDLHPGAIVDAALVRLQRNLFKESASAVAHQPATSVEIFSAPGEGRECVEIARRVLARAREGIPFDQIAVLLRSPEEYRANLEEAFERAAFRLISPAVPYAPTRPGAHFTLCSNVPPKACRHAVSPNTCLWGKCLTQLPAARRPLRPRAGINGSNPDSEAVFEEDEHKHRNGDRLS